MASHTSGLAFDIAAISALLLEKREVAPRARIVAQTVSEVLPGTGVVIYVLSDTPDGKVWEPRALTEVESDAVVPLEAGTIGSLAAEQKPLIFSGKDIPREDYAHLHIRRTVHSLAYLPVFASEELIGAIEIISFEGTLTESKLGALQPLAGLAGPALAAAISYEQERQDNLASISRLAQFYDIEKVFSATLEMDQLLPLIASKIREMVDCEAVNVWLVNADESLLMMEQAGFDPTVEKDDSQRPGEGIAGDVSDSGEPVLITDPEDSRIMQRNRILDEGSEVRVESLIATALLDHGSLVGVVEAVNKLDGSAFDDDDLFVLTSLSETASSALHNASLLLAERKVEILETLVTVSHEITSTLNLERMLQTIVNAPQAVIPYERAAIALEQNGKYKLSAITGMTHVDTDVPQIAALNDVLRWAMLSEEVVNVRQHGEEVEHPREETRAKFQQYFSLTGMRGFYAIPLTDDTGRVGILGLESSDPDFLSTAHLEILQVLAGQATVALRNAQMYKRTGRRSARRPATRPRRRGRSLPRTVRAAAAGGCRKTRRGGTRSEARGRPARAQRKRTWGRPLPSAVRPAPLDRFQPQAVEGPHPAFAVPLDGDFQAYRDARSGLRHPPAPGQAPAEPPRSPLDPELAAGPTSCRGIVKTAEHLRQRIELIAEDPAIERRDCHRASTSADERLRAFTFWTSSAHLLSKQG